MTTALYLHSGDVQGNCGSTSRLWLLAELEKSTAGRVEYPPLRPYQCVLVIDKPFLFNLNATLWLDSLYIAVSRTKSQSNFTILHFTPSTTAEYFDGRKLGAKTSIFPTNLARPMYITSSTFVGEGRGSTRATFMSGSSLFIEGSNRPLLVALESVTETRSCSY
jgi:hypothetical protein